MMEDWLQLQEKRNRQNLQSGQSLKLEWKKEIQLLYDILDW